MKSEKKPKVQKRKIAHIDLAASAQIQVKERDDRFYYEPMLAAHPQASLKPIEFLGKTLRAPIWVSSMTGGTALAYKINHNLAKACKEFGMGMGLGSCRVLLENDKRLKDFDLRAVIGEGQLLLANLGIAQLEQAVLAENINPINNIVERLNADGLIIHVNPLQEWLQPEGDNLTKTPLSTIKTFLKEVKYKVIVKEVGQGMGPASLKELLKLPLAAVDFSAFGGTNFAQVELLRSSLQKQAMHQSLAFVGHSAEQMVHFVNQLVEELGTALKCQRIIISGGIKSFLDGYYLTNLAKLPAIYGQASAFLEHAKNSYKALKDYVEAQIEGLALANALFSVKKK
ncbi:MAG: isopentenyl-diphosphate delta-isomerase [Cytophagales bacterium]|nr:isopentenyl-diphosphate delta-isomerase [Cytophagales bacterium]